MAMWRSALRSSIVSRFRVPVGRHGMSYLPEPVLSKQEVEDRVMHIVKAFPKVDPDKVTLTSHFQHDLGLDSLDMVEVVMGFEQDFHLQISDEDSDKIVSVPAAVDFIAEHPMAR